MIDLRNDVIASAEEVGHEGAGIDEPCRRIAHIERYLLTEVPVEHRLRWDQILDRRLLGQAEALKSTEEECLVVTVVKVRGHQGTAGTASKVVTDLLRLDHFSSGRIDGRAITYRVKSAVLVIPE